MSPTAHHHCAASSAPRATTSTSCAPSSRASGSCPAPTTAPNSSTSTSARCGNTRASQAQCTTCRQPGGARFSRCARPRRVRFVHDTAPEPAILDAMQSRVDITVRDRREVKTMQVQFITSVAIIAPTHRRAGGFTSTRWGCRSSSSTRLLRQRAHRGQQALCVWPLSRPPRACYGTPDCHATFPFRRPASSRGGQRQRGHRRGSGTPDAGLRPAAPARAEPWGQRSPASSPRRPHHRAVLRPLAARPIRSHNLTEPRRAIASAASRQRRPDSPSRDRLPLITRHHRGLRSRRLP